MFIAIDIGNTHTVIGAYEGEVIKTSLRLKSNLDTSQKEIEKIINALIEKKRNQSAKISGIGISSVVPLLTNIYSSAVKKYFKQRPFIVSSKLNLGIKIHYDNPKLLGVDRICNAIAGYVKYGGPLIIIDFGTATTYDVISSNGDFLGGVIAPGIKTSASALHNRTAKLPMVDLILPTSVIGVNTTASIQTGILWGAIDAMTGMVNRIKKELRKSESRQAIVIATGGFSDFASKHTNIIEHVEPTLVLDGIRLIYEQTAIKK